MSRHEAPLIVIVGPTASGKTSLAIQLAKQFNGEIISADSRALYRGMDIGTAKPSVIEREGVPHWGVDIINPDERFTVVDFQRYAHDIIQEIRDRSHVPMLVGGTGLYVDSVVYDYQFPEPDEQMLARRKELESWSIQALHKYCIENNIELPENTMNKRYVVNNIIRKDDKHKRNLRMADDTIVVGITTEKSILWSRIEARAKAMWQSGLVGEAERIASRYGWQCESMTGNAYQVAKLYGEGILTEEEAQTRLAVLDRQLAKRQLTWFRRSEHIVWLDSESAYTYLAQLLEARSIS